MRPPQSSSRPGPGTPEAWSRFLEKQLDCRVGVTFGRSLSYPIQVRTRSATDPGAPSTAPRRPRPGLVVRMHTMFADASHEVAESVASWIRSGRRARRACTLLDRWLEERMTALAPRTVRRRSLCAAGEVHDLQQLAVPLLEGELARDFGATPLPALTWGRRGQSRTRRSLRLGSFDVEAHLVRIHPVLDQRAVPVWFVRYVLFHELLHAAHPPVRRGSRWIHHGAEFRRRERMYPDYARALEWEEKNLPRLIRSARTAVPMRVRTGDGAVVQGIFDFARALPLVSIRPKRPKRPGRPA